MSDISLDALRLRERELELDAVLIRGRMEEVRTLIDIALRRRGGRPRKATAGLTIINEPAWDGQAPTEPGEAACSATNSVG